jgi:hypothetical protein
MLGRCKPGELSLAGRIALSQRNLIFPLLKSKDFATLPFWGERLTAQNLLRSPPEVFVSTAAMSATVSRAVEAGDIEAT